MQVKLTGERFKPAGMNGSVFQVTDLTCHIGTTEPFFAAFNVGNTRWGVFVTNRPGFANEVKDWGGELIDYKPTFKRRFYALMSRVLMNVGNEYQAKTQPPRKSGIALNRKASVYLRSRFFSAGVMNAQYPVKG